MSNEQAAIRLGDYWFSLAVGSVFFDATGLRQIRPLRKPYQSLFPERQTIQGDPGVQNLRSDDLRLLFDSWAAGEGQQVIAPGDATTFKKFDRSVGIDLALPGRFRIAKAMVQQGLTGGATTTHEGSTFAQDVATATVVGTDIRLDNVAAAATKNTAALTASSYQFDIYAYIDPPTRIEGNTFDRVDGTMDNVGSDKRLKSEGATVQKRNRDPADGPVTLTALVNVPLQAVQNPGEATAKVKLVVRNHDNGALVAQQERQTSISSHDPVNAAISCSLTYTAAAGKTYDYLVTVTALTNLNYVDLNYLDEDEGDTKTLTWQIKNGSTVVASGTVDMNGITMAGTKVASATIVAPSTITYTMRVVRTAGATRRFYLDKVNLTPVAMNDPRLLELGLNNKFWLVDSSAAAAPHLFVYDPTVPQWTAVGAAFGAGGDVPGAIAHTDHYVFITNTTDRKVWRSDGTTIPVVWTNASPAGPPIEQLVGVAYGGARLYVLTESQGGGTKLYPFDPEAAAGVAFPASAYTVGNTGVTPDVAVSRRVAGTAAGVVFFANQGPDCIVYTYDGQTGVPLTRMTPGFRGRAITNGNGFHFLGGSFPTVDNTGATRRQPAVAIIDPASGVPTILDVKLYRDDDTTSQLMDMQLYGTDLWVLCSVGVTKLRLWRISLRDPIAAFCEQEVTIDESQSAGDARMLAVTFRDRFAIWSKGLPYLQSTAYMTVGSPFLRSSRYNFGLTEQKELLAIDVMGDIPAGTFVEVGYYLDGGPYTKADQWYTPGRRSVSQPGAHVFFNDCALEARPRTTDGGLTPVVYQLGAKVYCQEYQFPNAVLLVCYDGGSVWHTSGRQVPGSVAIAYLENLIRSRGVVEYEDRFSSKRPDEARTVNVLIQNPDFMYVKQGEALVELTLMEAP